MPPTPSRLRPAVADAAVLRVAAEAVDKGGERENLVERKLGPWSRDWRRKKAEEHPAPSHLSMSAEVCFPAWPTSSGNSRRST